MHQEAIVAISSEAKRAFQYGNNEEALIMYQHAIERFHLMCPDAEATWTMAELDLLGSLVTNAAMAATDSVELQVELYRKSVQLQRLAATRAETSDRSVRLAKALDNLGRAELLASRPDSAIMAFQEAIQLIEPELESSPRNVELIGCLALLLSDLRRVDGQASEYVRSLANRELALSREILQFTNASEAGVEQFVRTTFDLHLHVFERGTSADRMVLSEGIAALQVLWDRITDGIGEQYLYAGVDMAHRAIEYYSEDLGPGELHNIASFGLGLACVIDERRGRPQFDRRALARAHWDRGNVQIEGSMAYAAIDDFRKSAALYLELFEAFDALEDLRDSILALFKLQQLYLASDNLNEAFEVAMTAERRVSVWFDTFTGIPEQSDWFMLTSGAITLAEASLRIGRQAEAYRAITMMNRNGELWIRKLEEADRHLDAVHFRELMDLAASGFNV